MQGEIKTGHVTRELLVFCCFVFFFSLVLWFALHQLIGLRSLRHDPSQKQSPSWDEAGLVLETAEDVRHHHRQEAYNDVDVSPPGLRQCPQLRVCDMARSFPNTRAAENNKEDASCWHLEYEYLKIPESALLNRNLQI